MLIPTGKLCKEIYSKLILLIQHSHFTSFFCLIYFSYYYFLFLLRIENMIFAAQECVCSCNLGCNWNQRSKSDFALPQLHGSKQSFPTFSLLWWRGKIDPSSPVWYIRNPRAATVIFMPWDTTIATVGQIEGKYVLLPTLSSCFPQKCYLVFNRAGKKQGEKRQADGLGGQHHLSRALSVGFCTYY